jgi:hypothetical protein
MRLMLAVLVVLLAAGSAARVGAQPPQLPGAVCDDLFNPRGGLLSRRDPPAPPGSVEIRAVYELAIPALTQADISTTHRSLRPEQVVRAAVARRFPPERLQYVILADLLWRFMDIWGSEIQALEELSKTELAVAQGREITAAQREQIRLSRERYSRQKTSAVAQGRSTSDLVREETERRRGDQMAELLAPWETALRPACPR